MAKTFELREASASSNETEEKTLVVKHQGPINEYVNEIPLDRKGATELRDLLDTWINAK